MQDAFATALERWPRDGVPRSPGAWIVATARNGAIDRIRRERTFARKAELLARLQELPAEEDADMSSIPDERLALLFTCCHPALAVESRVALTLREVGGLATPEIARAFLVARARARPAARPRQAASTGHGDPVPRPARPPPSRPASRRPARALPRLQRGLRGQCRRRARAPRALRRGDPVDEAPLRPDARRARGVRAPRAPAPAGLAAGRPPRRRRRARAARRPGSAARGTARRSTRACASFAERRRCVAPARTSSRP